MPPENKLFARRYALEGEIARGPLTIVYRARDEVLARTVAIKVVRHDLPQQADLQEALRERTIAAAGLTHPNIAATYDTGEEGNGSGESHYVVLEFCPRGTLQDVLGQPMPLGKVVGMGLELCDALSYAHKSGIVHGDLHPRNVLLADDGTVKVTDFGNWRLDGAGIDADTEPYLAPERGAGAADDPRLDVYSVGALLFAAATGKAPDRKERGGSMDPRSVRADVPRAFSAAVTKALAEDPVDRYPDVRTLHDDLAATRPPVASPRRPARPVAPTPPPRQASDFKWLAPVIALIAVAIALSLLLPGVLEDGGPAQDRNSDPGSRSAGSAIGIAGASDFDPHGDGSEHPEDVAAAFDGESTTAWTTENYNDPLPLQGKAGVGLVFELEGSGSVDRIDIQGVEGCDIEVRVADSPGESEEDFELVAAEEDLSDSELTFDSTEGRYWLIWITNLPGDGAGSAQIYEVRFFGS